MINTLKSVLTEYGVKWTINRALYSLKLKMMSTMPYTEYLFEKRVNIKRVDIFDFNIDLIKNFLSELEKNSREK